MRGRAIRRVGAIALVTAVGAFTLGVGAAPAAAAPYVVQIATDPTNTPVAQHQTIVEPVTAAWGSTIVSTYQVGRYAANGSGAAATGWSTSTDGGVTWTSGLVPNVTTSTTPPGIYPRTVNMTIAYDRAHAQFILTTLGMEQIGSGFQEAEVFVTRSSDGLTWTTPQTAVIGNRPDKDWTVCDNTPTSAFYGRCYIVYSSDNQGYRFQVIRSDDGGATWSAPVATPSNSSGYNVNPVVRPDGTLVVVATNRTDTQIVAFRSTNGGVTLTNAAVIATMTRHDVAAVRDRPKPSATLDAAGRVYAAWFDCRFRASCSSNDIVLVKSDDGLSWSSVQRVDVDPVNSTVDHFVAGLGARPGTSGASAQLDLIFYQMPVAACTSSTCDITAVTTSSTDGGTTWAPTTALNTTPMKATWLPNTTLGRMLTDYQNIVYRNGVPMATLPLATAPVGATSNDFRQALYFARLSPNNLAPVAAVSDDCIGLDCVFDASASTDPDGSVVAYAWDFGDGTTATGPIVNHTFASTGYAVSMTVTDNLGLTHTVFATDQNQSPVAAFTSSCVALVCTVDASTSSDPDGTIALYDWAFSDGTTATGVAPQHTFFIPGTWPAQLTVTDNDGGTASVAHTIITSIPVDPGPYATDAFNRTTSSGWGTADVGGPWSTSGTATNATVNGSEGRHTLTATGTSLGTSLGNIASSDTELRATIATDRTPTGAGHWTSFILRRVSSTNEYRVRVKYGPSGVALAAIKLPNSSTSQFVGSEVVTPFAASANQQYQLRAQVLGTNPTIIRAKVWPVGQSEPSSWTLSQFDSTATIQAPGSISLSSYVSGSVVPTVFSFDNLIVQSTNRSPIPQFSRSCTALACNFDATASNDPDGTIASYDWSFGDGAAAVGNTAAHTYGAAGSYTVTMTATDDLGARVGTAQTFSVNVGGGNIDPVASFTATCTALACGFDAAASSDSDGSIVSYDWTFSDGATATGVTTGHTFAIPGVWPVSLAVTDDLGATASVAHPATTTIGPTPAPLMSDTFTRIATSSWGTAEVGGAWTVSSPAANFAVNGAVGTNRLTTVNSAGIARLFGTSLPDADVQMRVAIDQAPAGSGFWLNVVGRSVSSANEYRARVRFASTGVHVGAYRVVNGGASSVIGSEVATGLASTPGQYYRVRMNVFGANPTTIKIKVWRDGTNEPANWLVSQTDTSASIQSSGTVGVTTWMQGTTPLPLTFTFDDVVVRAANQAPNAATSVLCTGLSCDANGLASTDPDGSIVAYDWSFGDGGVAFGPTPTTHEYAAPGAYVVTLTVTDNNGQQNSATQVVTVN